MSLIPPQNSPFTQEFTALNEVITQIKTKISSFKSSRQGFHKTIKDKITEINKLITEINVNGIKEKQQQINELKKQLNQSDKNKTELQFENETLENEKTELATRLKGLSDENITLKKELERLSREKAELETQLKGLSDENINLKAELERLSIEKTALETTLTEETTSKEGFAKTNETLLIKIKNFGKQLEDCNAKIEVCNQQLAVCNTKIEILTEENEQIKQKQTNHETELNSLLRNQQQISDRLNISDKENKILKQQIDAGKLHIQQITSDILKFVGTINNLDTEDVNIGVEIERIMTEILALKNQLNNPIMIPLRKIPNISYNKDEPNAQRFFVESLKDILLKQNTQMQLIIDILNTNGTNYSSLFVIDDDDDRLKKLFEVIDKPRYEQIINIINKPPLFEGGKSKKRKTFKKNKRINKMRKGGWTYKGSPSLDSKSSVITDTSSKTNSKTKSDKTRSKSSSSKSKSKSKTNRNNKKHKTKKVIKRSRR
jgi:DNA repair exonuclease SbcCD ATPase subunit